MSDMSDDAMIERIREAFDEQSIPQVPREFGEPLLPVTDTVKRTSVSDWLSAKVGALVFAFASCLLAMVLINGADDERLRQLQIEATGIDSENPPPDERTPMHRALTRFNQCIRSGEWDVDSLAVEFSQLFALDEDNETFKNSLRALGVPQGISICNLSRTQAGIPTWLADADQAIWIYDIRRDVLLDDARRYVDGGMGEGIFEDVLEGIYKDPNGPKIDLRKVLEVALGNRFFVVDGSSSESKSDGWIIGFGITDSAVFTTAFEKAMNGEPSARRLNFPDCSLYRVSNELNDRAVCCVDQLFIVGRFTTVHDALKRRAGRL